MIWLFRRNDNPFADLKDRLLAAEQKKERLRRLSTRLCRRAHRQWNREVRHLLKQLAAALRQSSEWKSRDLHVDTFTPYGNGSPAVGWRLYEVRPYGLRTRSFLFRECEPHDVVTVILKLNEAGEPVSFELSREEDGMHAITESLTREELVAAFHELFQ